LPFGKTQKKLCVQVFRCEIRVIFDIGCGVSIARGDVLSNLWTSLLWNLWGYAKTENPSGLASQGQGGVLALLCEAQ